MHVHAKQIVDSSGIMVNSIVWEVSLSPGVTRDTWGLAAWNFKFPCDGHLLGCSSACGA